ncbi:MAG TPA: beta-propeller fold lactonase family protein [Solirubrobacteraceae bacterium]|nr:beta-propeller fold lactonase family protein [Solirubrobacteraceae bacterium]
MEPGRKAARIAWLVSLVAAALALLLPASALAHKRGANHRAATKGHHHPSRHGTRHDGDRHGNPVVGTVYTTTNDPSGNGVIVLQRHRDGTLTQGATVPTGGTGIAAQPPFTFPIVDSSGSIALAKNGHLVFVVNDGDNTITSFQANGTQLRRASRVSSGGVLPVSLTTHGHLLYVVNEMSSTISGYYFSDDGRLWSIPGSEQLISPLFPSGTAPPNTGGVAAQISFSPDGGQLIVTERGLPGTSGAIDTFEVNPNGSLTLEQALTGAGVDPNPFGFAFTNSGKLLVSNVGQVNGPFSFPAGNLPIPQIFDPAQFVGSTSSYTLSNTGTLTPISTQVASGGRGACWLVVSGDGRYAFVTNTLSSAKAVPQDIGTGIDGVSRYKVAPNGTLSLLGTTNAGTGDPTDEAVSSDGKFLYVSVPTVSPTATSHIDVFGINGDGSLTTISVVDQGTLPGTISGLAAN